jgi:hypothetical protein
MFVCLYVCLFVPYANWHFWTDRNQTLHMNFPLSGRDRRVCIGPKFLTSSNFWAPFFRGRSWAQDGCRRDRFPRYPYIRGSSWCSRDVTDITLSLAAESSAAVLYPWFKREVPLLPSRRQSHSLQRPIPYSGGCSCHVTDITFNRTTGPSATALYPSF